MSVGYCSHNRPVGSHCTPCRVAKRSPANEILAARKVVEAVRVLLAEDIHVPPIVNARRLDALAATLAEHDKAVGG